jgi:hypothetical protein
MGKPKKVLTGQTFGELEVLYEDTDRKESKRKRTYWICKCSCGIIKSINSYHLLSGRTITCGCRSKRQGSENQNWQGYEEISGSYWRFIKNREFGSKQRKPIKVEITIEYVWDLFIKQNRRCALSNLELTFPKNRKDKTWTASLDRIDSSKGYLEENLQWVHKDVNWMKNNFDQKYFIEMCKLISKNNDSCEIPPRK